MRPDEFVQPGDPGQVNVHDLCVLAGRDPDAMAGYVLLLVPADVNDGAAVHALTDAPTPAALLSVLASVTTSVADALQLQGESRWSE